LLWHAQVQSELTIEARKYIMSSLIENRYVLSKENSERARAKGLAEATWYRTPVPKAEIRQLLERRDGPAIRDTLLWFALIFAAGYWAYSWWGRWWAILPFAIYGTLYASSSDSRWHESGHGTAFKTDWMNNALYEIASFMVMRESSIWRWSHTRHHSDTIIVGRDPEIQVPRPPNLFDLGKKFFGLGNVPNYWSGVVRHCFGLMSGPEKDFVPQSEYSGLFIRARIYVTIYALVIGLAAYYRTILPLLFIGLPNLFGPWLMNVYSLTQHAGLAENVLDHRLNCRTVYMNPVNRYLYWNMNYHLEHHMFPLVPYHNLPRLHQLVKWDTPEPYIGLIGAFREIIPAVLRQTKDPGYHVKRQLPSSAVPRETTSSAPALKALGAASANGWVDVCNVGLIEKEDVVRFDHHGQTFAIYRTIDNQYHATDGICTHGNAHLADGFVKGKLIECSKHNGRFDLTNGSPVRLPACVALRTYPVQMREGRVCINLASATAEPRTPVYTLRVLSNENVATFIKELVLEPMNGDAPPSYQPGQYMQMEIPQYGELSFAQISVKDPFAKVWRAHHIFDNKSRCDSIVRRNYSLATNPSLHRELKFNIRIATPPRGQDCDAGVGSTYAHSLRPGDKVRLTGPLGDFLIKNTNEEMIYLGGGAGMSPLRSHLSFLFDTLRTTRKVSFWYGARSKQELFYQNYFDGLAEKHSNFSFHAALSEPLAEDDWAGPTGFVHEVLRDQYLKQHPDLTRVEFYLCGSPAMMQAAKRMLMEDFGVAPAQIAYDEF
jgi:Na+-transporting NADH:ubiquinone oxidoreductase subunit F